MVTIVDPFGTPVQEISAPATNPVTITPISRVAGVTVALVTAYNAGGGPKSTVELPSDAEIGDVVEIYLANNEQLQVVAASGDSFGSGSTANVDWGHGTSFRKVSANYWGVIQN